MRKEMSRAEARMITVSRKKARKAFLLFSFLSLNLKALSGPLGALSILAITIG